jgi:hypothetical protein
MFSTSQTSSAPALSAVWFLDSRESLGIRRRDAWTAKARNRVKKKKRKKAPIKSQNKIRR